MSGAIGSWELDLLLGGVLSLGVAAAARVTGALTRSGAAAAIGVGTVVFGFGGWRAAVLLLTFFASSSLLTRWRAERKLHPEHRGGRRGGQVLANGLVASVLAVWAGVAPSPTVWTALAGAIAASTADTWATEVGMAGRAAPRLITTWRPVPPGTSGAITFVGTAAGVLGALLIAILSTTLLQTGVVAILVAGTVAMIGDSLLGATVEGRSPAVTNDVVNLLATTTGAVLGGWLA